jgi:hypothetical protein
MSILLQDMVRFNGNRFTTRAGQSLYVRKNLYLLDPCGIDFLTSVGIGIGFCSIVGFRSVLFVALWEMLLRCPCCNCVCRCQSMTHIVHSKFAMQIFEKIVFFFVGGLSMRDSATSAMRGLEQQKPDGSRSRLILSQLFLLES